MQGEVFCSYLLPVRRVLFPDHLGVSWGSEGRLPTAGQFCLESLQVACYTTGQHFLEHEVRLERRREKPAHCVSDYVGHGATSAPPSCKTCYTCTEASSPSAPPPSQIVHLILCVTAGFDGCERGGTSVGKLLFLPAIVSSCSPTGSVRTLCFPPASEYLEQHVLCRC